MSDRVSRRGMFRFLRERAVPQQQDAPAATPPAPKRPPIPVLRPPGALPEAEFLAACTRCGDCAKACPHGVLHPAHARMRGAAGTPTFDPYTAPCLMCQDVPCAAACPTEALSSERSAKMGTAQIRPLDCLAPRGGCWTCSERCPVPWVITTEPGRVPRIDPAACTGCGVCAAVCPAPARAIMILPRQVAR